MFEQLTPAQTVFMVVAWAVWAALIIALFVGAWHVGWIARSPVQPGARQPTRTGPAMPRTQPEPQMPDDRPGRHRRYPDPVPEEETPSAPVKASVPAPTDMTAVDAVFRDTFSDKPDPLAGPTQKVSTVGWPDNPPAPSVPFPVEIDRQNRVLRERLDDPERTELIPPVPSRRGAA